jgi:hypothetical protein
MGGGERNIMITTLIYVLDVCGVYAARLVAVIAVTTGTVFVAAYLLDILLHRAGYGGLLIAFAFQECKKSPRKFWARLFWGAKEEKDAE